MNSPFGLFAPISGFLTGWHYSARTIWLGLPDLENWIDTILPVAAGPAIIVGGYWLVAWLGQKRIERDLTSDDA